MLSLSARFRFSWVWKNFGKVLLAGFGLVMLAVSCGAIINALNIMAAESDRWTIEADGSGLLNVLTATSVENGDVRKAYCLDPYTDFTMEYPDYVYVETTDTSAVEALLKRAYPVLTAQQMGIVYLNDPSLTDLEAYEATQIAIWEIVTNGEYEVNEVLVGRTFALVDVLLESDIVINDGPWLTVDNSEAVRQNSTATRDSYGPVKISVDTGSAQLDAAIMAANLTLTPATADRNWRFSTSSSAGGGEASTIRADGTSYYINFAKVDAGVVEFSLSHALADSKYLTDMDQVISIYGEEVNQILGVVLDSPKTVSKSIEMRGGSAALRINKTWRCGSVNECMTNYGAPIYFDVYERVGDGYNLLGTATAQYDGSISPNTAQEVLHDIELETYTEYVVIERTLVPMQPDAGDVMPRMTSNSGSVGNYKVVDGVLETASSGEAYYAGVKLLTGMNGSIEVVNAENRSASMNVTVQFVPRNYSTYPASNLPSETNFYIYSSVDAGVNWTLMAGPVKVFDYGTGSGSDYNLTMTPGTRYRVVQDTKLYSNITDSCPPDWSDEYDVFTSLSGTYYTNLTNRRTFMMSDFTNPGSAGNSSTSLPITYRASNGSYPAMEWQAGWTENSTIMTFTTTFDYEHNIVDCDEEPELPRDWTRDAAVQKLTEGSEPGGVGWGQDYNFHWEVTHAGSALSDEVELDPDETGGIYTNSGSTTSAFPSTTYVVYEDPLSFCAGVSSVFDTETDTINGITRTTTYTSTTSVEYSVSGSYSSWAVEYSSVDCAGGTIAEDWSSDQPSGEYVARVIVTVGTSVRYSDVTISATNKYSESSRTTYSTGPQDGVALILKYGWDGYNLVAEYLDGTEFEIYDTADNYVMDWTLSGENRGLYGNVGGVNYYYATPELPAGEYYLKEVQSVAGYIADPESKFYFTVEALDGASGLSITQVRKNGVAEGNSNFQKAIKNAPGYELAVFKFKRKVLANAIEDSRIELFRETETTDEPAYGNENLRGYEKVMEFESLEDGIIVEELVYGWYKLVEVMPPSGFIGPTPQVAVGFKTYIGPRSASENNYSGARVYIANDWVGLEEPPEDPEDPENPEGPKTPPEVPKTGAMSKSGGATVDGGLIAAVFIGIGGAMVLVIAMFVGKRLTVEIEDTGKIGLNRRR